MSRRHFLISSASRRKLIFENIQGVYKVFGGCSVKEKRQEKQHLEATDQTLKRHKIRFPRQSLANAQTLFSSVISWFLQPESVKVSLQSRHSGKMSAHAFNQPEIYA